MGLCWWQYRNRKLQDQRLIETHGTPEAGKTANMRTDFSARESYEQQDAATGQKYQLRERLAYRCLAYALAPRQCKQLQSGSTGHPKPDFDYPEKEKAAPH